MGGWVNTGIGILASILLYGTGHAILLGFAIAATVIAFWSHGVMHNYAMDLAKERHDRLRENMILEGRAADDLERLDTMIISPSTREIASVPNWITRINMTATLANVLLLLSGVLFRFL